MAWNTVVAGGGFAGLYAVRALERRLPRHSAKISIVSRVELVLTITGFGPRKPPLRGESWRDLSRDSPATEDRRNEPVVAAISAARRSSGAHPASPSELDLPTDRDRPVARQPEVLSGLG
jgi:hypothetical protein